jgi:hypothetical protein
MTVAPGLKSWHPRHLAGALVVIGRVAYLKVIENPTTSTYDAGINIHKLLGDHARTIF